MRAPSLSSVRRVLLVVDGYTLRRCDARNTKRTLRSGTNEPWRSPRRMVMRPSEDSQEILRLAYSPSS